MNLVRSAVLPCLLLGTLATSPVQPVCLGGQAGLDAATQPATRPVRPIPGIERVVVISVDGLRPDLLIRAKTPNLRALMEFGAFSFWARTTDVAITLPSHTSMLTGMPPEMHGITWNDDSGDDKRVGVPTVFEVARQNGYSTAMAAGKSKFVVLAKPGTLDSVYLPPQSSKASDIHVAGRAAAMIKNNKPELLMIHLPDNDTLGHQYGWGSGQQVAGLEKTDEAIGMVLAALDEAHVRDNTLIILTADHGGQGKGHGANDVRSRHIPWIASGPGIKRDHDLNLDPKTIINTEDTCATVLYVLGLTPPEPITGKPVLGAFEVPAPATAPVAKPPTQAARVPVHFDQQERRQLSR